MTGTLSDSDVPSPPRETVSLSVVVVSWNTRELLDDCLRSLTDGGGLLGIDAEVFVVDNASADGSADLVRTHYTGVHLIESGGNLGFARGNNLALRQARGRWLLLLNSDTIVPAGALAALVAAVDHRPDVVVAGPLLLNADGSLQESWARFLDARSEWAGTLDRSQCPHPATALADPARRTKLADFVCDWIGGACFLVRATAARKAGYLDEGFFMYSEETEWCLRLRRQTGGSTVLVPSVAVTHLGGGSSRAVPKATRERMFRSAVRFYRVAYGPLGALVPSTIAWGRFLLSPLRRSA